MMIWAKADRFSIINWNINLLIVNEFNLKVEELLTALNSDYFGLIWLLQSDQITLLLFSSLLDTGKMLVVIFSNL